MPGLDAGRLAETCRRAGVRLAVLFGSRAGAGLAPRPDSDVDIGVASDRVLSFEEWNALYGGISDSLPGMELDLVAIGGADPLLRWEIMRDGVLLFGDELDALELRAFAYRDFVDSADLRALERSLFEKKLAFLKRRRST